MQTRVRICNLSRFAAQWLLRRSNNNCSGRLIHDPDASERRQFNAIIFLRMNAL
jgi:hypothetical protein